jgi:hypothetical protein
VSVNTAAIARPELLAELSRQFGSTRAPSRRVRSRRRLGGRSPHTGAGVAPGSTPSNGRPVEPNSAWGRSCSTRWTTTGPRRVST